MKRRNFYYRQKVTESELDSAFNDVEEALKKFVQGFQYVGIALGAVPTEATIPNLTIDLSGPAVIYDQTQDPILWSATQNLDLSIDENGSGTAVTPASGNEKWLSVFAEFERSESDPRIDGLGNTVYFFQDEGFSLNVVQGAESAAPATRPGLRGDQILLCDVLIQDGTTAIINSMIDTTRSQVVYDLTGSPLAVRERNLQDVLQAMVDQINLVTGGSAVLGANQTFTGDNTFDGEIIRDPARVNNDIWLRSDRITAEAILLGTFRLATGPDRYCRLYYVVDGAGIGGSAGLMVTNNVAYNNGAVPGQEWVIDDATEVVSRIFLGETGVQVEGFNTNPTSPFANADWADATQTASSIDIDPNDLETVFKNMNVVFDSDDAATAPITYTARPADHPSEPGNFYKKLVEAPNASGTGSLRVFSTNNGFAISLNADWDPTAGASGEWSADVAHATDNPALLWSLLTSSAPSSEGSLLIKADTSSAWTTWDTSGFSVDGMGDISIAGNYQYAAPRLNTIKELNLWDFSNANPAGGDWAGVSSDYLSVAGAGSLAAFPIRLPHGCNLTRVRALVTPFNTGTMAMQLVRYHSADYGGTPAAPTKAAIGSTVLSSGTALQVLEIASFSQTIDALETYAVLIQSAQASDRIYGVQVWFSDVGLTNK